VCQNAAPRTPLGELRALPEPVAGFSGGKKTRKEKVKGRGTGGEAKGMEEKGRGCV